MTISLYKPDKGTHIEWFKKTASTAYTFNDLVRIDSTGYLILGTDGSTVINVGFIQETVASTDATNKKVPVLIPGPDAIFLCDVSTGTAAAEDVGQLCDVDDENSVDIDANTYGIFQIVGIISTTKVLCKFMRKDGALATNPA
jgi:hypothetical protein